MRFCGLMALSCFLLPKWQKKKEINLHLTRGLFASSRTTYRRGGFPIWPLFQRQKSHDNPWNSSDIDAEIINFRFSVGQRLKLAYLQMYETNGVKGNLIMGNYCNVHENTHLCGNGTETNNNAIRFFSQQFMPGRCTALSLRSLLETIHYPTLQPQPYNASLSHDVAVLQKISLYYREIFHFMSPDGYVDEKRKKVERISRVPEHTHKVEILILPTHRGNC